MLLNTWDKLNSWKETIFTGGGGFWGENTGWPNSCGIELFTDGWIQCGQQTPGFISEPIERRVNFSRIRAFLKRPRLKL